MSDQAPNRGRPSGAGGPPSLTLWIDDLCDRFEAAWRDGRLPEIESFLGPEGKRVDSPALHDLLVQLVKIDLEYRWQPGAADPRQQNLKATVSSAFATLPWRPRLADYVARYPLLGPLDQLPTELILQEYRVRQQSGERCDVAEYLRQFPAKADWLRKRLGPPDAASAPGPNHRSDVALVGGRSRTGDAEIRPVETLEQLRQNLVASGLMSDESFAAFLAGQEPPRTASELRALGQNLLKAGKLTPYQLNAVLRGDVAGLVFGEYRVLEEIGRGGMGVVVKAEHRRMRRVVAVKMIAPGLVESSEAVRRFYREVETAARLSHPNIVTAYDAGESDGRHYLVMEYVDGQSAAQLVQQQGPFPIDRAVKCLIQVAKGLQYAHDKGVVHRDIKPANLLLDSQGTVKILDMGLARMGHILGRPSAVSLTQTGQLMGTCDYMSPEQGANAKRADHRTDIYSLGCTLYYLLLGHPVYQGGDLMERLLAHRDQPIPRMRAERSDVPPWLDDVFRKMVAKSPAARYQSMAELQQELRQRWRESSDSSAPPLPPPPETAPRGSAPRVTPPPRIVRQADEDLAPASEYRVLLAEPAAGKSLAPSRWLRAAAIAALAAILAVATFLIWRVGQQNGTSPVPPPKESEVAGTSPTVVAEPPPTPETPPAQTTPPTPKTEPAQTSVEPRLPPPSLRDKPLVENPRPQPPGRTPVVMKEPPPKPPEREPVHPAPPELTGLARDLDEGQQALQRRNFLVAIDRFTRVLDRNADDRDVRRQRGRAYQLRGQTGDLQRAVDDLNQCVAADPHDAQALLWLAQANAELGVSPTTGAAVEPQASRAIELYSRLVALKPDSALALSGRGVVHIRRGETIEALRDASEALALDENCAAAHNLTGLAYAAQGQQEMAFSAYSRALAADPDDYRYWANRGDSRWKIAATLKAADEMKRAYREAVADWDKAVELPPPAPRPAGYDRDIARICLVRGQALSALDQPRAAVESFTQALRHNDELAEAYYFRGEAYEKLGERDAAQSDRQRAVRLDPKLERRLPNRPQP